MEDAFEAETEWRSSTQEMKRCRNEVESSAIERKKKRKKRRKKRRKKKKFGNAILLKKSVTATMSSCSIGKHMVVTCRSCSGTL